MQDRNRSIFITFCLLLLIVTAAQSATFRSFVQRSFFHQNTDSATTDSPETASPQTTVDTTFITPPTEESLRRAIAYLATQQQADGSFGSGRFRGNVAVTALSGMSFLAAGEMPRRGKYGDVVVKAIQFLLSRSQANGYIVDEKVNYQGPMYAHGFATLFLAEAYGTTGDSKLQKQMREKLKRAVELIIRSQNPFQVNVNGIDVPGGGWRYLPEDKEADVSVTVCQVMALRAARNCGIFVPKEVISLATAYVKACQNHDGGFRYQTIAQSKSEFPRSAAAVVALYSAGIYKGREVQRGLNFLLRYTPRPKSRGRQQGHYFYAHYYAVQAMWQAGGEHWKKWFPAIRDELLKTQQTDGRWKDNEVCDEYGTAMSCLILQTPLNYLPIFQR